MTGCGILDCRKALAAVTEANPDVDHNEEGSDDMYDEAVTWLRQNGLAKVAKKSGRDANEGLVGIKLLQCGDDGDRPGKKAVLVVRVYV